jgi:hypothetical protein
MKDPHSLSSKSALMDSQTPPKRETERGDDELAGDSWVPGVSGNSGDPNVPGSPGVFGNPDVP